MSTNTLVSPPSLGVGKGCVVIHVSRLGNKVAEQGRSIEIHRFMKGINVVWQLQHHKSRGQFAYRGNCIAVRRIITLSFFLRRHPCFKARLTLVITIQSNAFSK